MKSIFFDNIFIKTFIYEKIYLLLISPIKLYLERLLLKYLFIVDFPKKLISHKLFY